MVQRLGKKQLNRTDANEINDFWSENLFSSHKIMRADLQQE